MKRYLSSAAIIVAAAIVGFALARADHSHSHSRDALRRTGASAAFSLRYPQDWHAERWSPPAGLALRNGLSVGSSARERLLVGTLQSTIGAALPRSFAASLSRPPRLALVELGGHRFERYLDLHRAHRSGVISVYLLATTRSTIVAACSANPARRRFTAECERVLATLRPRRGAVVSGGVDAGYALGLNGILGQLNPVRRSAGPGLRSTDTVVRARAARRLARAESAAAAAASRLAPGGAASVNRTLVAALHKAAGGYRRLARATVTDDVPVYKAAQSSLQRAQRMLAVAFRRLARIGYRLR